MARYLPSSLRCVIHAVQFVATKEKFTVNVGGVVVASREQIPLAYDLLSLSGLFSPDKASDTRGRCPSTSLKARHSTWWR